MVWPAEQNECDICNFWGKIIKRYYWFLPWFLGSCVLGKTSNLTTKSCKQPCGRVLVDRNGGYWPAVCINQLPLWVGHLGSKSYVSFKLQKTAAPTNLWLRSCERHKTRSSLLNSWPVETERLKSDYCCCFKSLHFRIICFAAKDK